MVRNLVLLALCCCVGAASALPTVEVDWASCSLTRHTAVSALVAADPEWTPEGVLSRTAVRGVRALIEAGAENLRLLNFNIFPLMSCAQVEAKGSGTLP